MEETLIYRGFHGFGKAKFDYGGLVRLKEIFTSASAASKNNAQFKSSQKSLENHLAVSI
jgi:hypothetical protein